MVCFFYYHEFWWLKTDASLQAALWYCSIEASTLSGCCQQKKCDYTLTELNLKETFKEKGSTKLLSRRTR